MSRPLDCPDLECWQTLVDEQASPAERERIERHLETCPACQKRLDQFEELGDELRGLARQVGDPTVAPTDPTLSEFLDRLHERKPLERPPAEPIDLYFLRPSDRPDLLGLLGDYEVQEVIGQGGMGVVLKAFEPALCRLVAIKVLSPALAGSATARRRFTREAQAAAAVCHDHVVAVHGVHETEGLPYLVMQYVAGESVQNRLDRCGPLEVEEIVRIGLQTAQGLAAAHGQGLIHRDVKPANLLLEGEPGALATGENAPVANAPGSPRVKITDFGLARMVDDVGLTRTGEVAGTPEYMAPEQARGEPIDHRADLFSLGSVLYACCTGVPPFQGSTTVAVLRKVSEETPAPIHALNPAVPAWLEALIGRLLVKDPAERFQSAAEVATLLEAYLAHLSQPETIPAPPPIEVPKSARPPSRSSGNPALALILLASLGLVALFAFLLGAPALDDPAKPRLAPVLPGDKMDVWSIVITPDGKHLAASAGLWDQPGEIGVWNLETLQPVQRFTEGLGVASIALSPDGKLLASGSWNGHVRIYDWSAGKQVCDIPVSGIARVAFSPAGQLLATATEDQTVQLWDLRGKLVAELEGDLFRFHCVAFSPDGKRLLAGGGDWKPGGIAQVTIWDVASRKQVLKLTGHQGPVLAIACSPDGKTIATGSVDRTVRLWDAGSGKPLKTLPGHGGLVEGMVFLADGATLVSGSMDRTVRFWDVKSGMEKDRLSLPRGVRAVCLTPDEKTLVVGGCKKTLKLFTTADRQEKAVLWDGTGSGPLAMDHFPVASPTQVRKRSWLKMLALLGLGFGFLMSLTFAIQRLRQRPRSARPAATSLAFPCLECGKNLKVRAELAGKKVKCPKCRKPTPVPSSADLGTGSVEPLTDFAPRSAFRVPRSALIAFLVAGVLAILIPVVLWVSASKEPYVSQLELLALRVRNQKTDTIDARPYPTVTDRDLDVLRDLPNLKSLNLDHTGVTDKGLKEVAKVTSLVSLSLTNTQVTDSGLAELSPLTALEGLRLDKLPITDKGLAHLSAFPKLRSLSLYQTTISDDGLAHLKQLTALEHLSLDETQIGDEGLRHLSQCSNLKVLKVWRTHVTPVGIEQLRKALPGLKVTK